MILDDGSALLETFTIIDYLHELVGPERALGETLTALEGERARRSSPYFLGNAPSHPDVMTTCGVRFVREAHPQLFDAAKYPRLAASAEACEAQPEFQRVVQPIRERGR